MEFLITPCSQLLTLAGPAAPRRGREQSELGLVEDGAVWIIDDRIQMAGPRAQVEKSAGARHLFKISAENCVVMPGFVDCHSRPVFMEPRIHDYEQRIKGSS
jgi:imidazolonepropionase